MQFCGARMGNSQGIHLTLLGLLNHLISQKKRNKKNRPLVLKKYVGAKIPY